MTKNADGVDLLSDGRVKLVVAGETITLSRPTVGQLRDQYDLLAEIEDAERNAKDRRSQLAVTEQVANYWRKAVDAMGDGATLPASDDLPVWLLSVELIVKSEKHWRAVPYLSGGE